MPLSACQNGRVSTGVHAPHLHSSDWCHQDINFMLPHLVLGSQTDGFQGRSRPQTSLSTIRTLPPAQLVYCWMPCLHHQGTAKMLAICMEYWARRAHRVQCQPCKSVRRRYGMPRPEARHCGNRSPPSFQNRIPRLHKRAPATRNSHSCIFSCLK